MLTGLHLQVPSKGSQAAVVTLEHWHMFSQFNPYFPYAQFRISHLTPLYPLGQLQTPVARSQGASLKHSHFLEQFSPYCPLKHSFWHLSPVYPGGHTHCPLMESQVPPLKQSHSDRQSGPHLPSWAQGMLHTAPVQPVWHMQSPLKSTVSKHN